MNGMGRLWVGMAVVLLAACVPTDEPYVPKAPTTTPSTESTEGPVIIETGPTNREIFDAIERAENALDGTAIAIHTLINSYVVSVIVDDELYEVTLAGTGIFTNLIGEQDPEIEDYLEGQVVTLADAIDAAGISVPGRVDSATITLLDEVPVYIITIEDEEALYEVTVDDLNAEVLEIVEIEE